MSNERRWWCFIVYPDDAKSWWIESLEDSEVDGFISPLHTDSGRPHRHVLICFKGRRDAERVSSWASRLIGCSGSLHVEPVECNSDTEQSDPVGYARYLIHNTAACRHAGKPLYSADDVICLGDKDYNDFVSKTPDLMAEMIDYIQRLEKPVSWSQFLYGARVTRMDWFRVLVSSRGVVIRCFLLDHNGHLEALGYGIDDNRV